MHLNIEREEVLEALLSGVNITAGVAFHMGEFIHETQVCGDAAGLCVGGHDVPIVAVVVGDFGEVVADFCKRKFCRDAVFAGCRVQEVGSFLQASHWNQATYQASPAPSLMIERQEANSPGIASSG